MGSYLVKRFLLMVLTLVGISIIIFVLLRLMPGNIADIMFDSAGFVDPAGKAQIEKESVMFADRMFSEETRAIFAGFLKGSEQ